ncbi:MAG: helix-turn-helix transcriptional regulator [Solirubrobacterales bacterium]|nr:helix-turn-helix transcriptional regulator [Solirubrobacterales bacterium]
MGLLTRELDPDPALRGVVRRATYFEERSAGPMRRVEGPMLGVVLLFSLGPDIEVAGERIGSFAAGLWDRPVTTGHFGEQRGYQLYLDVLGARRLLGVPMSELSNRLVPLEDLLGRQADELTERLAGAGDVDGCHALAQAALARRHVEGHPAAPEVAYALDRVRASRGAVRVEALAAEVGWSARHLATRFHADVGLAPKVVARLARVEHAVALLRAGRPLADVAYAGGYADQPHFNREFRALVGCTPGEFRSVQDTPVPA